jgi:ABC-2 type transport system permease protein
MSRFYRIFILSAVGFQYADNIKAGNLNGLLLKPYNIGLSMYFRNLGNNIMQFIPQLIAFGLLVSLFFYHFMTWNITVLNAVYLLAFLIVSTVSSHLLWSILGELAFFMQEATAVLWSFTVLLNFLTGYFIPLDFFPKWSIAIITMLPFSSWVFIPTKIYLGVYSIEYMVLLLVVNLGWLPVLYLIKRLLWKRGIKKYSSVGG